MSIEYTEVAPVPPCCAECSDTDCYACDNAGERWIIPKRQELELKKKLKLRAITRYQRVIEIIDRQIAILTEGSK